MTPALRLIVSPPKRGPAEFTVEGACIECHRLGWFPADSGTRGEEIQRCDACMVFPSDAAAHAHAIELAIAALRKPRPRSGKRFAAVLVALQTAADARRE